MMYMLVLVIQSSLPGGATSQPVAMMTAGYYSSLPDCEKAANAAKLVRGKVDFAAICLPPYGNDVKQPTNLTVGR